MSDTRTFTCAVCGETFEDEWSEQEASAELAEKFPGVSKDECASACDDCFNEIMRRIN